MLEVDAQQEGGEQSEEEGAQGDELGIVAQESVSTEGDSERIGNHDKDDGAVEEVKRGVVGPRAEKGLAQDAQGESEQEMEKGAS